MLESGEMKEKIVMEAYLSVLPSVYSPMVSSVAQKLEDVIQRNAYDIIYQEDLKTKITDDDIHGILSKYRCVHQYFGNTYFDAQNVLFKDWISHLRLLRGV